MITPLGTQILQPVSRDEKNAQTSGSTHSAETPDRPVRPPRPGSEGLVASIMADGGLEFLRSRLEDKLGALFEKATADNPESAAAGPAAFFESSADVSSEATADRIVGFALGLKGIYSRQNPEMDQKELMAGFEAEIRRGISEGFDHARSILGGLDMLSGQVQDNVAETWDLIQQKLENFFHPPVQESDE